MGEHGRFPHFSPFRPTNVHIIQYNPKPCNTKSQDMHENRDFDLGYCMAIM